MQVVRKEAESGFGFSSDFIENFIKFCGAAAYFSLFNMFTFTQTKLKMAYSKLTMIIVKKTARGRV